MKQLKFISLGIILIMMSSLACADQSPVTMLKSVSTQMIAALKRNQSKLKKPHVIPRIVNRILVPHVDVNRMGAQVVGRRYWFSAPPKQRQEFINQFKHLVISTYAAALSSYNGDKIYFYPLRENYKTKTTVEVRSVIVRRSGQRIPVSYNLHRVKNSWKVYDFSIENISMVQSYRAQFAGVLSQYGMLGLNKRLIQHNRASNG